MNIQAVPNTEVLTRKEVLDYLKISDSSMYKLEKAGIIKPSFKFGSRGHRYLLSDIQKLFIKENMNNVQHS